MSNYKNFINDFLFWVNNKSQISGVALVGSYARGDYNENSDVDIVIITDYKETILDVIKQNFEFDLPIKFSREEWGILSSLRVYYSCGLEVEFGVVGKEWVKEPLDQGTINVVTDGFRVLLDKEDIFSSVYKILE